MISIGNIENLKHEFVFNKTGERLRVSYYNQSDIQYNFFVYGGDQTPHYYIDLLRNTKDGKTYTVRTKKRDSGVEREFLLTLDVVSDKKTFLSFLESTITRMK